MLHYKGFKLLTETGRFCYCHPHTRAEYVCESNDMALCAGCVFKAIVVYPGLQAQPLSYELLDMIDAYNNSQGLLDKVFC